MKNRKSCFSHIGSSLERKIRKQINEAAGFLFDFYIYSFAKRSSIQFYPKRIEICNFEFEKGYHKGMKYEDNALKIDTGSWLKLISARDLLVAWNTGEAVFGKQHNMTGSLAIALTGDAEAMQQLKFSKLSGLWALLNPIGRARRSLRTELHRLGENLADDVSDLHDASDWFGFFKEIFDSAKPQSIPATEAELAQIDLEKLKQELLKAILDSGRLDALYDSAASFHASYMSVQNIDSRDSFNFGAIYVQNNKQIAVNAQLAPGVTADDILKFTSEDFFHGQQFTVDLETKGKLINIFTIAINLIDQVAVNASAQVKRELQGISIRLMVAENVKSIMEKMRTASEPAEELLAPN